MAKVKRIDHLAIAVKDADAAAKTFKDLLNAEHIRTTVLKERAGLAKCAYMRIGENIVSLIQSVEPDGFINKFIEKRGEGMHHLGLEVDNLEEFTQNAREKGYGIILEDEFSNRREVVMRPRETLGVVLQIMEWTDTQEDSMAQRIQRILDLENME